MLVQTLVVHVRVWRQEISDCFTHAISDTSCCDIASGIIYTRNIPLLVAVIQRGLLLYSQMVSNQDLSIISPLSLP